MSNSPLELHSADFGIFGASQTPSLVSAPKIPKSYESQTENPSVVLKNKNGESTNQAQNCNISSLRGESMDLPKQSTKNPPSLAEGARGWVKTPSLREFASANSWQSTIKISRTQCNQISPDSWCKKSDSSEQKCERRFFARIGKSEALPLKAKSGSFWRVGGAGWGVQPFCEKKQAILKNKVAIILSQNLTQIPKKYRIHTQRNNP